MERFVRSMICLLADANLLSAVTVTIILLIYSLYSIQFNEFDLIRCSNSNLVFTSKYDRLDILLEL